MKSHEFRKSSIKTDRFISFAVKYVMEGKDFTQDRVHLTDIIGWISMEDGLFAEQIFEKMRNECFPLLDYQDFMDIERTLVDARIYFNKAMKWKEADGHTALKQHVGCMMYLLAHNHRDIRGTAAETEWLERAIYAAHGFRFSPDTPKDREPDLFAFTTPGLGDFMKRYLDSFNLVSDRNLR